MLPGRERECARIDGLVQDGRQGWSGALLLRGEAGIGKTALLQYACETARDLRVLRARGVETESELPFATLSEALSPLLDLLTRIPSPQAAALEAALALGPPAAVHRLAVAAGTLSLLAVAAEERPVLLAVDDLHWADGPSAEALLFVARRLAAESIVLVGTAREEGARAREVASGSLPVLTLPPLSREASSAVLHGSEQRPIHPDVAEQLLSACAGNPLALVEATAQLSDGQLAGAEQIDRPLRPSPSIERSFRRRLQALPGPTRTAATIAAAEPTGSLRVITLALGESGLPPGALDPAEEAGIVRADGERLAWRHPLVRSAAYHSASPAERRAAHRALAGALARHPGASTDAQRAWHLAAAASRPDEEAAGALEAAAAAARRSGGFTSAARTHRRAAELSVSPRERRRRLAEAARDFLLAGDGEQALSLLDGLLPEAADDPLLRADVQRQRMWLHMWGGQPSGAPALLEEEAVRVAGIDAERAILMLVDAALAATMAADIRRSLALAKRATSLAAADQPTRMLAAGALSDALILNGQVAEARPKLARCRELFAAGDPLELGPLVQSAGHASVWVEDHDAARAVLERAARAARSAGALGLLGFPLACLSELDFRVGRWSAAYQEATESMQLAEELGQPSQLSFSLVCLARVEAGLGRDEDCRQHVTEALALAERLGVTSVVVYGQSVLGFLDLGAGRTAAAADALGRVAGLLEHHGMVHPNVVQWLPDRIEAHVLNGDRDGARAALCLLEEQVRETGSSWASGAAARCMGMLAGDEAFEPAFAHALEHHSAAVPFERARTLLRLGERRRRARRLVDARAPLREALDLFEDLGAAPWAARTRAELAASGDRPRPGSPPGLERLSPQELQMGLMAADGLTNQEIASAAFLSAKTVEFHLGKVYRKLGLRSRTELARALHAGAGPSTR